jgi:hypothetical protein
MLPVLIFFAGLVWLVAALIAFSLCAVARRSDDAMARMARDPRLG